MRHLNRRGFLSLSAAAVGGALLNQDGRRIAQAPPSRPATAAADVIVAAGDRLGNAAQIADFLGAGGGLYYVSRDAMNPVVQAWQRLRFRQITFETLHAEDPVDRWITVSRTPDGIVTDFTAYDSYLASFRSNLRATPYVYLGNMPRALSLRPNDDEHYAAYAPRDMAEWRQFIRGLVGHNVDALGLRGLTYGCMGEPDHTDSWRGSGTSDRAIKLREHVELFAATFHAAKEIDPDAKVGGPATMNWRETRYTVDPECTLEEWIRELASYNARAPSPVVPDYIAWQDYAWSSDRLSEGADVVARMLQRHGFNPATRKMLSDSGWGSWCSDYLDPTLEPHVRASHAAHNIVREFKNPRDRRFWQALYFHFYWDDTAFGTDDLEMNRAIALVRISEQRRVHLTPLYAAFEIASAMSNGEIVASSAPEPLEAMAVRDDATQRLLVVVNNHTEESRELSVRLRDVPFGRDAATVTVQVIDRTHSAEGAGLERGTSRRVPRTAGEVVLQLSLGAYATAQITVAAG